MILQDNQKEAGTELLKDRFILKFKNKKPCC